MQNKEKKTGRSDRRGGEKAEMFELVPAEADILRSEKKATSLCLINALGSLGSL